MASAATWVTVVQRLRAITGWPELSDAGRLIHYRRAGIVSGRGGPCTERARDGRHMAAIPSACGARATPSRDRCGAAVVDQSAGVR